MGYQPFNKRTKVETPTFIEQSENQLIIRGIKQWGVNVDDPEDLKQAYEDAMDEAMLLIAYLKTALVPFGECRIEEVPDKLFIPEYRHYEGRYTLTVSDILENRDFTAKIALASSPVDAGKFVGNRLSYVIADPKVYAHTTGLHYPRQPGQCAHARSKGFLQVPCGHQRRIYPNQDHHGRGVGANGGMELSQPEDPR